MIFNMAGAAILDSVGHSDKKMLSDLIFGVCVKFFANLLQNGLVFAV